MKPINLKLKGLNSYIDEQEIDFESLCSKGLFGIFGPTGCGKSTILDAVTIALYGAQGMARDTKDFINTETEKAVIKYVFSLKNNEGTRVYEISRSFKNSKTGVSNDMAKLVVSDASGDLIEVLDKAKEVNTYLEDLLGLTADDFMRSVVLPQGKFSEFLKLKDAERRRMIERLLNLQEFGVKLADKIKKQKDALKTRIEHLDGNISALNSDGEESIEDIENEVKTLTENLETTSNEYKEFCVYLEKIKELYKKTNELNELTIKLSSFDKKSNYIDNLKSLLLKASEASKITPIFSELTDENKSLEDLTNDFKLVNTEFIKIEEENMKLSNLYDEKSKEKEEKLPSLVMIEAKLVEMARLADENETSIKIRDNLRNEFKSLKEAYDTLVNIFLDIEKLINDTNIKVVELEEAKTLNHIDSKYKTMAIELRTKDQSYKTEADKLETLNKNKSELELGKTKTTEEISELEPIIDELGKKLELSKSEYEKSITESDSTTKTLHDLDKKIIELKNSNDNYKIKLSKKEEILKEEKTLIDDKKVLTSGLLDKEKELSKLYVILDDINTKHEKNRVNLILNELTSELIKGSECPLCGNEEHPHIHKKVENDKTYESEIDDLKKIREALKESITGLTKDIEFNESKYKAITSEILELKEFESSIYDEKLKEQTKLESDSKNLKEKISKLESDKSKYKSGNTSMETNLEKDKVVLVNLKNKLESTKVKLSECDKNIIESEKLLKELDSFIREALAKSSFVSLSELLEDLYKKESILLQTEKELKASRELVHTNQSKLKEMQVGKDDTYKTMTSIKEKGTSINEVIKSSEKKIAEVTKNDPRVELGSVKKSISDINESYKKANDNYKSNNERYIKLEKDKAELSTTVEISIVRTKKLMSTLEKLIANSSFKDVSEFESSIMPEEDIKEKTDEVLVFEKDYILLKSNISKLNGELKDDLCNREKYDDVMLKNDKYNQSLSELNKNLTIRKTKLQQLEKNAAALKEVLREKNVLLDKQGTINEISKLTNGNKFVEFVAMNHLRYIAADASTRLIDITNGRYSLELDYNGAFVICDNYNGGVKRSCQSLSGGETFMTSLSLALALSTHIQLKGSATLEFFILDEGFGTLDVDLLDTVMNSLEKLRTKNISVGVISHVEELKNRVPMRLSVTAAEPGLHGTKVKIESN